MIGHDLDNTRFNPHENTIAPNNVSRLKVKWTFDLAGDFIQSTPVVVEDRVYFASYDGHFRHCSRPLGMSRRQLDCWE